MIYHKKTLCADKYLVRDYIKTELETNILIPLLNVYDNANEIDFDKLPNQFVLKCNHGSGWNIIVKDKNKIDIANTKEKLTNWLKSTYGLHTFELNYINIPPKIICEKYLEDEKQNDILDYKFFCFNGDVKFAQIMSERGREYVYKMNCVDMDFNEIPIMDKMESTGHHRNNCKIDKPKNWEKMKEYAKILSQKFKFVRVDFYEINSVLYFGELTFYPNAGYTHFKNQD